MPPPFGRINRVLDVTPPVSISPNYSDGDCIGGLMSFAGAARGDGVAAGGFVHSVTITDKAANAINIEVIFFDADPSATTFTDNGALDIDDADLIKVVGTILVSTWQALADNSFGYKHTQHLPYDLGSGTVLYGVMIATGATNLASTSDLTVRVGVEQD